MPYRTLQGRTMGVLGMGDIGGSVAAAGTALGMRVWGLRRSPADATSSGVSELAPRNRNIPSSRRVSALLSFRSIRNRSVDAVLTTTH